MKETFTYKEIQEAQNAAIQLGQIRVNQKTAYRLARIIDKLKIVGKDIGKQELELYKKYGKEKTPGKGDWTVPDAEFESFMPVLNEFMDNTVEVEFMPIACNMFAELPAAAIVGMGKFMIEEELITTLSK